MAGFTGNVDGNYHATLLAPGYIQPKSDPQSLASKTVHYVDANAKTLHPHVWNWGDERRVYWGSNSSHLKIGGFPPLVAVDTLPV